MKVMIFCIFEESEATQQMLRNLNAKGYNGTIMGASSVNHAFGQEKKAGAQAMFSLSDYAEGVKDPNLAAIFLVNEDKREEICSLIREETHNFKRIHGGMIVTPALSYEGSF